MTPTPFSATTSPLFLQLGVAQRLVDALTANKITQPSPIQQKAIPIALEGKDVIGIAQTGTGKTFAFGLPLIQRLSIVKGRGLVILPTRELALQVEEAFQQVARQIGLRTAVLIGGASMHLQMQALRRNPHVIIATPGRLIDHLEQKTLGLKDVTILVLDEADRMLDMGFAPQIKRILEVVPKERQTMLFSATMPSAIAHIAASHMKLPVRVEVAPQGTAAERVEQEIIFVKKEDKIRLLESILSTNEGTVLVFSRTKHGAKRLTMQLRHAKYTAAEIHSNRSLAQRREALDGFKSGRYRVLVATDIAARGIDVKGIAIVVNYDLPDQSEDYIHRIGRTGRADKTGRAISFATPDQSRDVRDIERLMRKVLTVKPLPVLPPARPGLPPMADDRPRMQSRGHAPRSGGYGQARSSGYGSARPAAGRPFRPTAKPAPATYRRSYR